MNYSALQELAIAVLFFENENIYQKVLLVIDQDLENRK